ncbi:MAG: DUF3987 domain-containing protein [Prevotella sp.]|nr:DUF3987 domain-containing protein [Prevotella sp.]
MKNQEENDLFGGARIPRQARGQGVRECLDHVGPENEMPALFTTTGTTSVLASDVMVEIHNKVQPLNQIVSIIGEAASKKSAMDEIFGELAYELVEEKWRIVEEEKNWRQEAKRDRNAKKQKDRPRFPMRVQTLNTTVANLAERLEDVDGKRSISFTPEIDIPLNKWGKTGTNEFSTMLRLSYDGASYEREAKSLESANVHIRSLQWSVIMCGQPESLYKLMSNTTNGLLSRAAIAKMHDNTYDAFSSDRPFTEDEKRRIHEVAHLLGLMKGTMVLPKLEARSIKWADSVCISAAKDGNDVMARCRLRDHVTAYRMTVCLMLFKVAEKLIKEHGFEGAEKTLVENPGITASMIVEEQTPAMLKAYDNIADYILDMDMLYFGEKLKANYEDKNFRVIGDGRTYRTANSSIYECLPAVFSREMLVQQCKLNNGEEPSVQKVSSMLYNWKRKKLIRKQENGYAKH